MLRRLKQLFRNLRRAALLRIVTRLSPRRLRLLAWHTLTASGARTVGFSRGGLFWTAPVGDPHIGFGLFVDDGFQDLQLRALLAWLKNRGRSLSGANVFVDVGANIGTTSIPVAHEYACRVLAIEPAPATFDLLRQNTSANALTDRMIVVNAAVVRQPGTVRMAQSYDSGAAFLVRRNTPSEINAAPHTTVECQGMPLDAILAAQGIHVSEVAVVWADVQGCEVDVIETGAALWAAGAPLWAEFETPMLAQQAALDEFFVAAGKHFDRFIDARDLLREGVDCPTRPIAQLSQVLPRTPDRLFSTDVLLLPPGC